MKLEELKQFVKTTIKEVQLLTEKHKRPNGKKVRSFVAVFRYNPGLEVLLVQDKNGKWTMPGGQSDTDETYTETAWRELKEETNIEPKDLVFWKRLEDKDKITYIFHAEAPKNQKIKAGTDAKGIKWTKIDDISTIKNFHKTVINQIKKLYDNPKKEIKEAINKALQLGLPVNLSQELLLEKRKRTVDGYLIVLEGIDGAGKSTQCDNLRNWLEDKGWKVTVSKWNESPHISDAIKKGKKERWLTPILFCLLHASDMNWRFENVIKPALDKGHVVICDRFYYTSYVRDMLRGIRKELLDEIYGNFAEPDLVIHFIVPPKLAVERLLKDKGFKWYSAGRDIGYKDNEEDCALVYEKKMDEAYHSILPKVKNYKSVQTTKSIDEIFKELKGFIREKLQSVKKSKFKNLLKEMKLPEVLRKSLGMCPKCNAALNSKGSNNWSCSKCGYEGPNEPLLESTPEVDKEWFAHYADFPGYKMPEPEEPYGKVNMHYWLSPSGHFYDADKYHWRWARENVTGEVPDAVERMIRNGWIRINVDVETGLREIMIQGRPNSTQRRVLEDFGHEYEMPVEDDNGRVVIDSTKEYYDAQQLGALRENAGKDVGDWHYWWLDPKLEFHPVEHEEHAAFAWRYLMNDKGMKPEEIKGKDVYYLMYELGWVRVGLARYQGKLILAFNYKPEKPPTNSQMKALKDWAIEKGAEELRDNAKGKWMYIDESMEYPMASGEDQQAYAGDVGWKGKIVQMEPDKFLKLAAPLPSYAVNQHALKTLEDKMSKGHPIDPLVLHVDMEKKKVTGHEGRHRAMVAKKLGIEKVPVLIYTGSGYERVPKWTKDQHDVVDKADFTPEK